MKNYNQIKHDTKSVKIDVNTSGCHKIHLLDRIISNSFKNQIVKLKIKANSNSEKNKLCIYNESYISSDNLVCPCSDFISTYNLLTISSIGEVSLGSLKLLTIRDSISEKLNFQDSMISLGLEFDFREETIKIYDSKNKEIVKVPLPTDSNTDNNTYLNRSNQFLNKEVSIGIISCQLQEEEDFIIKIIS